MAAPQAWARVDIASRGKPRPMNPKAGAVISAIMLAARPMSRVSTKASAPIICDASTNSTAPRAISHSDPRSGTASQP